MLLVAIDTCGACGGMSEPLEFIQEPCKFCKKPIGKDRRGPDGKYQKHYNDSSGREHKTCFSKRVNGGKRG